MPSEPAKRVEKSTLYLASKICRGTSAAGRATRERGKTGMVSVSPAETIWRADSNLLEASPAVDLSGGRDFLRLMLS
jgi:hypothetical protein